MTEGTTIPAGAKTCFFKLLGGNPEEARKWAEYTKVMEQKALEIVKGKNLISDDNERN